MIVSTDHAVSLKPLATLGVGSSDRSKWKRKCEHLVFSVMLLWITSSLGFGKKVLMASLFSFGVRSIVTLALTILTSSQAILIVWSKRAGKYEYSVTTANFMVRLHRYLLMS